jgi:hypothetical protein
VVEALLGGPQRFNDLLGQIPGTAAPGLLRTGSAFPRLAERAAAAIEVRLVAGEYEGME